MGILRRWSQIRYRGILSTSIGIVVVVSGAGAKIVGLLEGAVLVIVGSGSAATILGRLAGTVLVVGRSAEGHISSAAYTRTHYLTDISTDT